MKKIIVVMRWLRRGGAEKNTVKIVNYLSKSNHVKLFVISAEQPSLLNDLDENVDMVLGCTWLEIFRELLFQNECKLVFCGDHRIAVYLSMFSRVLFWKRINVIFRCINNMTVLLGKKAYLQKKWIKLLLSNVKGVIAQCNEMKHDLVQNWGMKSEKVEVIYNSFSGENIDYENTSKHKSSFKGKFLYVGRFSQQKRLDLMVESFLKANIPDSRLTLVGFRSWMDEDKKIKLKIDGLTEKYKASQKVVIVDWTESSESYMSECGSFLLSSEFEGFPNVLIEAISKGIPIVSSNCKFGPSEIIDEFNGILVDPVTIDSYSAAIKSVYSKDWDNQLIQRRAEKFSDKVQLSKLNSVFYER